MINTTKATTTTISTDNNLLTIRIILVGNNFVGKTCLLNRYCENRFSERIPTTIGVEIKIKNIHIDNYNIRMCIYDTTKLHNMANSIFKGKYGYMMVYRCDNRQSFVDIEYWIHQIQEEANLKTITSSSSIVLIGNCKDSQERKVTYEEGKALADKYGIKFFETSAKMEGDKNIEEAFHTLGYDLIQIEKFERARPKMESMEIDKRIILSNSRYFLKTKSNKCY